MDNDMKELLQQVVDLPTDDKLAFALSAIKGLAPEIQKHFDSEQTAKIIISVFATSVAADGKLTSEEFALVKAFLSAGGIDMPDEKLVEMLASLAANGAYEMVNALNKILSTEGQAHLIALVTVICAIDDRIDSHEVSYIMDLYKS